MVEFDEYVEVLLSGACKALSRCFGRRGSDFYFHIAEMFSCRGISQPGSHAALYETGLFTGSVHSPAVIPVVLGIIDFPVEIVGIRRFISVERPESRQ